MTIKASDISLNLSGGNNNSDQNLSLGGDPSQYPVTTNMANLFSNITATDALTGYQDYRCFYVFNNNDTYSLYNINVYFDIELDAPQQLLLGLALISDLQRFTISGNVQSGYIVMRYGEASFLYTGQISWGDSYQSFRANLETALNLIDGLSGVTITATANGTIYTFDILFSYYNMNKYQPTLFVSTNNLLTNTVANPEINIAKTLNGSPINTIPDLIADSSTSPNSVIFYNTSATNTILVGTLAPYEGFPIWVKRTIPVNADATSVSGATFKLKGGAFT